MTPRRFDKRNTICMFAGAAALGLASSAPAQFVPDAAVSYPVGTQPSGVAPGDYDGDGDTDLASTVDNLDRIVILLNDGSGQYTAGPQSNLPASSSPQDLIAGDLDGDGDMDLAVAVRDPAGSIVMMMNNGSGFFTVGQTVSIGDRPRGLSISDIDNDGDMDLAAANRDSNSATVIINTGAGYSTQTLPMKGEPRDTVLADFDGDGDDDLAVTDHDNRAVEIFVNNAGTFSASATLSVGGVVRPDGVTAADLDGDSDQDLAVAVSDQTLNVNQAMVFINAGGNFSGPTGFDTGGSNTSDIVATDLDCDGLIDVATVNSDSNDVSMLQNLGGGVFGAAQIVTVQLSPDDLAAADLDGDGDSDLVAANRDSGSVSVIRNDTCAPCPWDIGGDGAITINDLLDLLAAWGPNPGSPADIDGNGSVDIVDLLALLANWGQCP